MLRKVPGSSPADAAEKDRDPVDRDSPDQCELDKALDKTLEQTFPASDPLSTLPGPCEDDEEDEEKEDPEAA